ncbi:hypothetical protein BA950_06075 [Erythrobacter sp. SAORIC-644]|uniref:hypothetical protein n=1 Tax=Erythrobacter sp. SAORIC-644 TaxID=1869314 RepID=UPI000C9F2A56|nr:hypothetical protein [Erythrobacter sp. SAORIC-644]PNQ76790.1 hypothetical protein BA950_06075 [Erythrobacter sp. SAORIC-644]
MSFMPARQGRFISAAELAEAEAARRAETRAKAAKPPAAPIPENPAAGASPAPAPAVSPAPASFPALVEDLPGDETRAPQTQFTLDLRIAFLEALAVSGSVRSAARRVKVSHQSVYRARRSSAPFGRAWDAAMVIARGQAEALLADYAMSGVEEEVWYHGEIVGTRRRVSDRLLLAHLGRLDRMRTDARIEALAEDFDGLLHRMRAGEPIDVDVGEGAKPAAAGHHTSARPQPVEGHGPNHTRGTPEILSPGQCNTRSMSPLEDAAPPREERHPDEPPCDCIAARNGTDGGRPHYRMGKNGFEPVLSAKGEGPCCGEPRWPSCRACPHYPPVARLLNEMEDQRPLDAPEPDELGGDPAQIEECQIAAFEAGDEDWWRYGVDFVAYAKNEFGDWAPIEDQDEGNTGGASVPK